MCCRAGPELCVTEECCAGSHSSPLEAPGWLHRCPAAEARESYKVRHNVQPLSSATALLHAHLHAPHVAGRQQVCSARLQLLEWTRNVLDPPAILVSSAAGLFCLACRIKKRREVSPTIRKRASRPSRSPSARRRFDRRLSPPIKRRNRYYPAGSRERFLQCPYTIHSDGVTQAKIIV